MSDAYASVFTVVLPEAKQVVDSFHAIALANRCLDAIRRRVQTQQLGHRGRRDDPLYRARRLLRRGEEHLNADRAERLRSLLELGDPNAEVARLPDQRAPAGLLSNQRSGPGSPPSR